MAEEPLPVAITETLAKATLAVFVPYGGAAVVVWDAVRGRIAARGQLTLEEITEQVGIGRLAQRLEESPAFEALTVNALDTAVRTGLDAKRRLLARVVVNAALDDARIDESQVIAQALRDLDAPHLRCLEQLRIAIDQLPAFDRPGDSFEPKNNAARQVTSQYPLPVLTALLRTGVAIGTHGIALGPQGQSVGDASEFGRKLLDELHAVSQTEIDPLS